MSSSSRRRRRRRASTSARVTSIARARFLRFDDPPRRRHRSRVASIDAVDDVDVDDTFFFVEHPRSSADARASNATSRASAVNRVNAASRARASVVARASPRRTARAVSLSSTHAVRTRSIRDARIDRSVVARVVVARETTSSSLLEDESTGVSRARSSRRPSFPRARCDDDDGRTRARSRRRSFSLAVSTRSHRRIASRCAVDDACIHSMAIIHSFHSFIRMRACEDARR